MHGLAAKSDYDLRWSLKCQLLLRCCKTKVQHN